MSFKIRVERITDGESFLESNALAAEEIGGYMKTLYDLRIFNTDDFRFVLTTA